MANIISSRFNGNTIEVTEVSSASAPGVTDDTRYSYVIGTRWYDTTLKDTWICMSTAFGAAVWEEAEDASAIASAAAADATSKANAAILTASGDASTKMSTAISTASGDASTKMSTAISTASGDASTKMSTAISTASGDATSKANAAQSAAIAGASPRANMTVNGSSVGGARVLTVGPDATHGLITTVIEELVDLTALGAKFKALSNPIPAGAVIRSVQGVIEELVVAGGTTVLVTLGLNGGTVDKYGETANLTLNQKIDVIPAHAVLAAPEQIDVCGAITGGAALGDTNISAGKVRVRIAYDVLASLASV